MDLNTDIATTIAMQKHSCVDNGTGEHVFDQHMVFRNQHNLLLKVELLSIISLFPLD